MKKYNILEEKYQKLKQEYDMSKREYSGALQVHVQLKNEFRDKFNKTSTELENYKLLYIEQVEKNLVLVKELKERERQSH